MNAPDRAAWLAQRRNGIGASDIAAVLGISPWKTPLQLYMDKRGGDNVNHSAHLWGAAYGVVFTVLVDPDVVGHFLRELGNPHF